MFEEYNTFPVGTIFSIETKTRFEKLPYDIATYEVLNDTYFDGERSYSGYNSPIVKCLKYTGGGQVSDILATFNKNEINNLLNEGYLIIKPTKDK